MAATSGVGKARTLVKEMTRARRVVKEVFMTDCFEGEREFFFVGRGEGRY